MGQGYTGKALVPLVDPAAAAAAAAAGVGATVAGIQLGGTIDRRFRESDCSPYTRVAENGEPFVEHDHPNSPERPERL